jgi:hypothetical protein
MAQILEGNNKSLQCISKDCKILGISFNFPEVEIELKEKK